MDKNFGYGWNKVLKFKKHALRINISARSRNIYRLYASHFRSLKLVRQSLLFSPSWKKSSTFSWHSTEFSLPLRSSIQKNSATAAVRWKKTLQRISLFLRKLKRKPRVKESVQVPRKENGRVSFCYKAWFNFNILEKVFHYRVLSQMQLVK